MDAKTYFEKIKEYKLLAKKEVGQNFLIDYSLAEKIVDSFDIQPEDQILEIGSGAGSLTYFLLEKGAKGVAIDIDEALITKLQNDFPAPSMKLVIGNALEIPLEPFNKIIGNLPYYITNSLLERILLEDDNLETAVVMVQKEAAARLLAKEGNKDYGPLNVILNYYFDAKLILRAIPDCFTPKPHISSSVILIKAKESKELGLKKAFYQFLKVVFKHRRKTILFNLSESLLSKELANKVLMESNIEKTTRAEQLNAQRLFTLFSNCNTISN